MIKADFHIHSRYSDGEDSPFKIIRALQKQNITYASITDHNNISFYQEHRQYIKYLKNINIINGVEITAFTRKGKIHILGYNFDVNNEELNMLLKRTQANQKNKINQMINFLKKNSKIKINKNDFFNYYKRNNCLSYVHIAEYMVQNQFALNIKKAFTIMNQYQTIDVIKVEAEQIIKIIKNAGGVAYLAHPISLKKTNEELKDILLKYKSYGLDGIEVYHSIHNKENTKLFFDLATICDLKMSCGSDYHGYHYSPYSFLGGINEKSYFNIENISLINKNKQEKRNVL